ncbi:hypothetical protein Y032_0103g3539 [Ancylostoma ceylanicum]|uniref:Uncharacterized protein n=1 Tax=Ancylostoma ceylanicum TaxID=53326 RepID=A0A016TGY5_9BILA|nr:hypothetical protein Y032_0103g3539 [Ancylostoma ceylanicum]
MAEPVAYGGTIKEVLEEIGRFHFAANDVRRANDFTELVIEYLWVAVVPFFIQIAFAIVAIGTLVLRYRSVPAENHAPFGKTFFDLTGHASMIIVAILFVLFAGSFVTAYIAMHMCVGFIEGGDPPPLEHLDIDSKTNSSRVDIIRAIQKCEKRSSLLNAVGIRHVWSSNIDELNAEVGKIGRALGSFQTNIDLYKISFDMKEAAHEFQNAVDGITGNLVKSNKQARRIKEVADRASEQLNLLVKELYNLTHDLHPLLTIRAREEFFDNLINTVSLLKLDQHITMQDHDEHFVIHSPQCQPIVLIWTVFGPAHCLFITHPTQGLWPSFLICATGSLFLYCGVSKASSYVKPRSSVQAKRSTHESKRRKEKLPSKKKAKLSKRLSKRRKPSKRKRKSTEKKKTKSAEIVSVQSKETSKDMSKEVSKGGSKEKQSAETDDVHEQLARQVNYDRTQDEEEQPIGSTEQLKEKGAKVIPLTQMPKVPWDNYEPSQKQYSWRVYRSKGQFSPLPKELIQSIRDWKPPPVSELTPGEREIANVRTQDEEEMQPALLPLVSIFADVN